MASAAPGRLRRGREFDAVFEYGRVEQGRLIVLRARPNGLGQSRWGFAVGKRLAPRSVVRNRLRRRLREGVRMSQGAAGWDFIAVARPALLNASFAAAASELQSLVTRAVAHEASA